MSGASCPVCPQPGRLLSPAPAHRARVCGACGGSFLSRDDAYQLIVTERGYPVEEVGGALGTAAATGLLCADCGGTLSLLDLGGVPVALCGACGGAWLRQGDIERLPFAPQRNPFLESAAADAAPDPLRAQPVASAPVASAPVASAPGVAPPAASMPVPELMGSSPRPVARPAAPAARPAAPAMSRGSKAALSSKTRPAPGKPLGTTVPRRAKQGLVVAGAAALVGGLALVGWRFTGEGETEAAVPLAPLDLERVRVEKYQRYFNHYTFGGRTVDWWSDRLNALAPAGPGADARLYQLTAERAERAGLLVRREGGRVVVTLSYATTAALLERLGVK